ncbi:hypothetical protein G6F57_013421 [Rhizopus arrhizus]|nr:hypothetical protein G6F24_011329 [Rhizopus arrhizus]KAG1001996.1 hypothetical protein G6F27_012364 [Rhizopus arrhizus]KAG1269820.1 hypothetical protein G6F65_013573 [Rhizopus arrhizus]KAG1325388.1 hypothetical protein G6F63_012178 [Rhizopus arrhizus]KAG1408462.1 hypothetical protein G6F59_012219 [Rhizopus arrhizus]
MRAVVKQLTSLNARPLSQAAKPFKATAKQPVIDTLALNALGTEASKHATAKPVTVESSTTVDSSTTATSSNPAAWITVAKRPAKPKYGVLTSERKRQATASAFNTPTPFSSPGYDYVYVHRSRRLNQSEIRQRFRKLGIDTSRILDISFPAGGIIGLLVHKEFKLILVQTLEHVADAKYNNLTGQDRVVLGYALNQVRCITILRFLRPYLVPAVARYYVEQKWMSNEMANALITERVPRPLKRRAMEPQALIKGILDKYRLINAEGQTEPMQIVQQEVTANNILRAGRHWRENGETSAGYLKKTISTRASSRYIPSLKATPESEATSNPSEMQNIAKEFYKNLYTCDPVSLSYTEALLNHIPEQNRLTPQMADLLTAPFSFDDILQASTRSPHSSSPGSDGLPYEALSFLFRFEPLQSLVLDVYNQALESAIFPAS